jgi:hypothetical protein
MIILVAVGDRAIPYGAWGYGVKYFQMAEREFFKRYGLISFPRTLLGAFACLSTGLGLLLPSSENWLAVAGLIFLVLFVLSAMVDVWRIGRV